MRIGDALVRNALRVRFDIEEAIMACDPNDIRQRDALAAKWSAANYRVQFLDQMNRAEMAQPE